MSIYSENKKAFFNYEILETFEAGIELIGHEVKSIKSGKANITGAYAAIRGGELWLLGAQIPAYQPNNTPPDYDPERTKKLLMKKEELQYLVDKMLGERLTIIPLKLYNKGNLIKIALGLGKSKKKTDKRETIKKREVDREIRRNLSK